MIHTNLTGEQQRQFIDTCQVWKVWRTHHREKQHRFKGSMRWVERSGNIYLLRKVGSTERSLGPKSQKTETAFIAFMEGRQENAKSLKGAATRLDQLARVNRAMGIGRLPITAARILRSCDEHRLLGDSLFVVGTNALYAYEALVGIRFDSGLLATGDIDLLLDTRSSLSFAVKQEIGPEGLIGVLRKADKSFKALRPRGFRAANENGYLVDLIRPIDQNVFDSKIQNTIGTEENDLEGAEIFGLEGLINAPKVEAIALDERGYPAPIVAIDPRVYALHKAWVSQRPDRDLIKKKRDAQQSIAVAKISANEMNLDFNGTDLSALPNFMRQLLPDTDENTLQSETPDW